MGQMMQLSRVKKVVIVGGGTAGWMTAAMMAKQLGKKLDITLVESAAIGTIGVGEATIPPIQLFNNVLGLDENEFVKKTQATFKLGIEFQNWGQIGDRYMHTFGTIGKDVGMIQFYQYWLRARREGVATDLWDYSFNYQAAMAGKFARLDKVPDSPLSGITYAFHFDAGLYAQFLSGLAKSFGVKRREGTITEVNLRAEDGFIQSVTLENGDSVEGDLFIDCSGMRALLIEGALKTGYHDWSHWLPVDRAIAVPSQNVSETVGAGRPYTQSIAHTAGWQWRIPLQHRTGNGHVFSSKFMSEDEATNILLDNLEGEPLAEPRTIPFKVGMRKKFWHKNCVAIGLSSGFLEPLESTSIHIIQTSITKLMILFPNAGFDQADIDEYNSQAMFDFERIRDFIILHYKATRRDDSAFWDYVRTMDIPPELTRKMELFKTNGRIFRFRTDLFNEPAWVQVMMGQGIMPADYHPMADALTADQLREYMANIKQIIDSNIPKLPSQADFIGRYCKAAAVT
jgi:tryptophan 7-halogenase